MQFHLTYEGVLMGSGRDDPRPVHKHELRRVFHRQLKALWDATWLIGASRDRSRFATVSLQFRV